MQIYRVILLIIAIALLITNIYLIFTRQDTNFSDPKTYLGIVALVVIIPLIYWKIKMEKNKGK
ncbi:MAG: hypothetical protein Q8907_04740 [Bacteroidota bacterium]|nr:hypothetical protein [Bacteroidota bacterium]MDP4225007.1 hypothetical protein [Bacteroidota bacterium]MDP4273568.1 hypothetical protein [Bacteroidota bacterium]